MQGKNDPLQKTMNLLQQPAKEGPTATWGPPCAPLKGGPESPERLSSAASEAATAATVPSAASAAEAAATAAGTSWLHRCPLCCCSLAACSCDAAAIAAQRERLRQQQELLHQQRLLLQQQHEQLEKEGSLQRQRKALLQQELARANCAPSSEVPEPQCVQRDGKVAPKGALPHRNDSGVVTATTKLSSGALSLSYAEGAASEEQQVGHQRSGAAGGDKGDSSSLEQLLGSRLYAAYKRLESKNLEGLPGCLAPPLPPPSPQTTPTAAVTAAAPHRAAAEATSDSSNSKIGTLTAAGAADAGCRSPCKALGPNQQPNTQQSGFPSPHLEDSNAEPGTCDPGVCRPSCTSDDGNGNSSSKTSRRPSFKGTFVSPSEWDARSSPECNELIYYSCGVDGEAAFQREPTGGICSSGSNILSHAVSLPADTVAAGGTRGLLSGEELHCRPSLLRDSISDCEDPLSEGTFVQVDGATPGPYCSPKETVMNDASSGCTGAYDSRTALMAIVFELQARLAAAEQQVPLSYPLRRVCLHPDAHCINIRAVEMEPCCRQLPVLMVFVAAGYTQFCGVSPQGGHSAAASTAASQPVQVPPTHKRLYFSARTSKAGGDSSHAGESTAEAPGG